MSTLLSDMPSAAGDPPNGKDIQALGRILVPKRIAPAPLDDGERVPCELLFQVELVMQRPAQRRDAVTSAWGVLADAGLVPAGSPATRAGGGGGTDEYGRERPVAHLSVGIAANHRHLDALAAPH
jgi:hypothetical protein